MSDYAIKVEGLGKKYLLRHQTQGRRYVALRDVLTEKAKGLFRRSHSDAATARSEVFWALKDVSFEVKPGEAVGIIGRNGAGKSTLLKLLSRISEPTTGRMRLRGRLASLLEVGTGFHPELTGRENIFLNGAILGMHRAEIKKKFDEIVAFAEVEKFLDTPVKRYSSGMYMRLAFAVAAHLEPEILIIDEVLAVGDAAFQKKCLGKMQEVSKGGRTVLFVSHNMSAVLQLTKVGILLEGGTMAFNGPSKEAVSRYLENCSDESVVNFDVESKPRKFEGTGTARFIHLHFCRPTAVFGPDEDFGFVARIRSFEYIPVLRTSMTIFTAEGIPVGSCFGHCDAEMLANGVSEIKMTLHRPNLAPGRYYCAIAVGKGDHRTGYTNFDVVHETMNFSISPEAGEAGTLAGWTSAWGSVRFNQLHCNRVAAGI